MGILRLLLALVVLIGHSSEGKGLEMIRADHAVEAFFILSGFYMSLVLNEKYVGENFSYRLFITNRLLRLYPIYWVMVIVTMGLSLLLYLLHQNPYILGPYLQWWPIENIWTKLYFVWTNLFILGQDTVFFLQLDKTTGALSTAHNFYQTSPLLYKMMPVGQAWSVSLEIVFYLVAPFLVRRSVWLLAGIGVLSVCFRLLLIQLGLDFDPWTYRLLPSEFVFFMAGSLSYRAYAVLKRKHLKRRHLQMVLVALLTFTVCFQFLPTQTTKLVLYYLCFACALPFIFMLTKNSKLDYKIGEYSYPLYICHALVLFFVWPVFNRLHWDTVYAPLLLMAGSFPVSYLLMRSVEEPVERLRQWRVAKHAQKPVQQVSSAS